MLGGAFFFFFDTVTFDVVFRFLSLSSSSLLFSGVSVSIALFAFFLCCSGLFLGPALGNGIISLGEKWLVDALFCYSGCSALTGVAPGSGSDRSAHSGRSVTLEGKNSCSLKMFLSIGYIPVDEKPERVLEVLIAFVN